VYDNPCREVVVAGMASLLEGGLPIPIIFRNERYDLFDQVQIVVLGLQLVIQPQALYF